MGMTWNRLIQVPVNYSVLPRNTEFEGVVQVAIGVVFQSLTTRIGSQRLVASCATLGVRAAADGESGSANSLEFP